MTRERLIPFRMMEFRVIRGPTYSNAWTCARLRTVNGRDYVAVGIWESNCITPAAAMRLVAHSLPA